MTKKINQLMARNTGQAAEFSRIYGQITAAYSPTELMYEFRMQQLLDQVNAALAGIEGAASSASAAASSSSGGGGGSSLNFDAMRQFIRDMDTDFGAAGLAQMGAASHRRYFDRHDDLLHGGHHHGVRHVRLRQLRNDIADKLSEHNESLE